MSEARRLLSATRDGAENQQDIRRSLLDDIEAALPQSSTCQVAALLNALPEHERAVLERALRVRPNGIGSMRLHDILAANGHFVSVPRITAHKAGRCGCRSLTI